MVWQLKAADAIGRLATKLRTCLRPRILVLDEVGYLPLARDEANLVFQMISKRYEKGAIVLTSNKSFSKEPVRILNVTYAVIFIDITLYHSRKRTRNAMQYLKLLPRMRASFSEMPFDGPASHSAGVSSNRLACRANRWRRLLRPVPGRRAAGA